MVSSVSNPRLDELPAVFRLLFSHLTQGEQETRLHDALSLVEEGHLDPDGIFVVRDRRGVCGAVVAVGLRGAGGVFWTPLVKESIERSQHENQLIQAGLQWLKQRGAKVAHALLYLDEIRYAAPLVRNGFARITRLQYLRRSLTVGQAFQPDIRGTLSLCTYAEVSAEVFQRTLERTYEGSLDCPELNGVRTLDEIMDGHRGQGDFDPRRWWLACAPEPAGVLLLADMPAWGSWDISYLGVVPEARRRGIGRALLQLAMTEARSAGVGELTVAVDVRNAPAWKLYADMGFQPGEQREVFLKLL